MNKRLLPFIGGTFGKTLFQVWLIPTQGDAQLLKYCYSNAELAADIGVTRAVQNFPGQPVEVVVFETMSREAVIILMAGVLAS